MDPFVGSTNSERWEAVSSILSIIDFNLLAMIQESRKIQVLL